MSERPTTRRDDSVVDDFHGEQVADPYRWLEDTEADEVRAWIDAQNAHTESHLAGLPGRTEIAARLAELWDVTRWGVPHEHGGRWFFVRHDAGTDQPVLRVADQPGDNGRVLLDPNQLSADGTVALTKWELSHDGSLLAYALSEAGSDWETWRVRDVATGEDHPDVVEWSKWSGAAWLPDNSGFFYGLLTPPEAGRELLDSTDGARLQLHLLGTDQADDLLVYADADPKWEPSVSTYGDGRWLVIALFRGTQQEGRVKVVDLHDLESGLRDLIPQPIAESRVVGSNGTTFFVLTNLDAPRRRLVAVDLDQPDLEHWQEIVAEGPDTLLDVAVAGDRFVCHVLRDASSVVQVWTRDGRRCQDVGLPDYVSVTELSGGHDTTTVHVGLSSFTDPASVWQCDAATGQATVLHDCALPIEADSIVISRGAASSADGTSIPFFLLHRRDVSPTGEQRALMYGYGGFDIPIVPAFNAGRLVWVERGGVLLVANLRGGGEFGRDWYDAGRLARKQNVFDDFAGCARWLAESGWSRPDRIAINGGSNGGLLVGAVLTQHPELIGAAVTEVGVLDLLRYHRFTIGWAWTSDYGDPDSAEQYQWVRAFSPLHNLVAGRDYPATLVMTGDHDDRVVPGHSFKFAAALQAAHGGSAPALIRVETAAGHGAGMPVHKQVQARADMLAFIEAALA
jgi:prolyl oligopeptidase